MEKELIFEELSVSNDVTQETERVYNIIKEEIDNMVYNDWYNIKIGVVECKTFYKKRKTMHFEKPIFDIVNEIMIEVVFFNNEGDYIQYWERFNFESEVNVKTKQLYINTFGFGNEICETHLRSTLSHEIHHIYQEKLISLSTKRRDLYNKALYIMNNESSFKNSICQFATLIYYFDKIEIEANMDSLYNELKSAQGDLTRVNTLITFNNQRDLYKSFKDYFYDEEFQSHVEKVFGISFKKIMNYLQRMIDYFEVKRNKVISFYNNERKLNEMAKKNFRDLYIL